MTSDPARRLRARLDCFAAERNPAIVLDPRALEEAAAILAVVGEQLTTHAEAVALVGRLRWYRFQLMPDPDHDTDLDEMIRLFSALAAERPDLLPLPVLAVLRPDAVPGSCAASMSLVDEFLAEHDQTDDVKALHSAAALLCRMLGVDGGPAEGEGFSDRVEEILRRIRRAAPPNRPQGGPSAGAAGVATKGSHSPRTLAEMSQVLESYRDRARPIPATDSSHATWHWGTPTHSQHEHQIVQRVQSLTESELLGADAGEATAAEAASSILLRVAAENLDEIDDLDTMIRHFRRMLDRLPTGHEGAEQILRVTAYLVSALERRFRRTAELSDLEEAIELSRVALASTSGAAPTDLAAAMTDLARLMLMRGQRTDTVTDLEEACHTARLVLEMTPIDDSEGPHRLSLLAYALHEIGRQTGELAPLSESVAVYRRLVHQTGEDVTATRRGLAGLALALRTLSDRTGDKATLEEAISTCRRLIDLTPVSGPNYPRWASHLALMLRARYEQTGAVTDLDEALRAARTAVECAPHDANLASNLGLILRTRGELTGALADLDEAIRAHRHVLALVSAGRPDSPDWLSNLALALRARVQRTGDRDDLDEAISLARRALAQTPQDHPACAGRVSNLALMLQSSYQICEDRRQLSEAAQLMRRAVAAVPDGHPHRARQILNLGGVLAAVAAASGNMAARTEAIAAFEQVLASPGTTWSMQAIAAMQLGTMAAAVGDWPTATTGFARAIDLLGMTAGQISDRDGQWHLLRFSKLASDAVACALNAEAFDYAVELFERGRGILYNRALDLHEDLSELAAAAPEAAARFADLRDRLAEDAPQRVAAASEWTELVEHIRAMPGFENFLQAPRLTEMMQAAVDGPIVLLNVSDYRSDAIVLEPNMIHFVDLPLLDPDTVNERYSQFTTALSKSTTRAERFLQQRELTAVLEWLWDAIVDPVLDRIRLDERCPQPELPRVWWCPSGVLSFLPLHAAGRYSAPHAEQPAANALDRVISSYTPTVRALTRSRRAGGNPSRIRALGVIVSEVPGLRSVLRGAAAEGHAMLENLPGSAILRDAAATRQAVLAAMQDVTVVHFACHGLVDATDPPSSRLLLADGSLTVRDISRTSLSRGACAYLSACGTARRSEQLPDEPVNLAAAFLLAGYRNVVATLWDVDDEVAAITARDFYAQLGQFDEITGAGVATALHEATRHLRDLYPSVPQLWAATIHVGT
ncbi:CHAT domain-containing protein [Nocardia sp. NPDC059240]|uniref:CHAT domain-containing protein n=1 Tax=Nocardia sp. NPDC059240 TaxID=3346786 RepID=UPI0036D02BAE